MKLWCYALWIDAVHDLMWNFMPSRGSFAVSGVLFFWRLSKNHSCYGSLITLADHSCNLCMHQDVLVLHEPSSCSTSWKYVTDSNLKRHKCSRRQGFLFLVSFRFVVKDVFPERRRTALHSVLLYTLMICPPFQLSPFYPNETSYMIDYRLTMLANFTKKNVQQW